MPHGLATSLVTVEVLGVTGGGGESGARKACWRRGLHLSRAWRWRREREAEGADEG